MTIRRRDRSRPSAGRKIDPGFKVLQLALGLLCGFALTACGVTLHLDLPYSGFEPEDPRPEYVMITRSMSGGPRKEIRVPEVESLQPRLSWSAFPGARVYPDNLEPFIVVDPERLGDVGYDLRIWRWNENDLDPDKGPSKDLVYLRQGIAAPAHRLEAPLEPGALYLWTVRARFEVDGRTQVSEWGMCLYPPILTAQTGMFYWGPEQSRRAARQLGVIPDANLFGFRTPDAADEEWDPAVPETDRPPVRSMDQVLTYLTVYRKRFAKHLAEYNERHRIVQGAGVDDTDSVRIHEIEVRDLFGKRVLADVELSIVHRGPDRSGGGANTEWAGREPKTQRVLFELEWHRDILVIVDHRPIVADR